MWRAYLDPPGLAHLASPRRLPAIYHCDAEYSGARNKGKSADVQRLCVILYISEWQRAVPFVLLDFI
jgi:hypothetical protein